MRHPRLTRLLVCVLLAGLLGAGCTSGTAPFSPLQALQDHRQSLHIAVLLGVGLALRDHPQWAPYVAQVARDAQRATQGSVDLTQLLPSIKGALGTLPVASGDAYSLQLLAEAIATEVQAYLGKAGLKPTEIQLMVSDVLGWVANAADQRLGKAVAG